jgi:hypothetical protein
LAKPVLGSARFGGPTFFALGRVNGDERSHFDQVGRQIASIERSLIVASTIHAVISAMRRKILPKTTKFPILAPGLH